MSCYSIVQYSTFLRRAGGRSGATVQASPQQPTPPLLPRPFPIIIYYLCFRITSIVINKLKNDMNNNSSN